MLGRKFPDDERDIRHTNRYDDYGQRLAIVRQVRKYEQGFGQPLGEGRTADDSRERRARRDADLNRRQDARWIIGE